MSESKPIKLAVVIPHYSTPAYLEATLRSVLACPEPAWVIVVDDGTPDREAVRAVVDRMSNEDYQRLHTLYEADFHKHSSKPLPEALDLILRCTLPGSPFVYKTEQRRVHLTFCQHRNQYVAMNQGIRTALALGVTHIAFQDADDTAYPDRFTRQLQALCAEPDLLAVGGMMSEMDASGVPVRDDHPMALMSSDPVLAGVARFGITLWPATAMFKAEVFQALGGFASVPTLGDTDFSMRLCFWCKAMGKSALNLDGKPVIRRRVHPNQVQANVGGPKSAFRAAFAEFLRQQHILFSTLVRIGALDPLLLYRTLECPTTLPPPAARPSAATVLP